MNKKIFFLVFLLFFIWLFYEKQYDEGELFIAASLPQSSIMKELGESVMEGSNAYFEYANREKILGKTQIRFVALDDKYEPYLTQKNVQTFLEKEQPFSFFGFVGTPTVKKILPTIEDQKVPFFAAFTGASFLRHTKNEYIVNFRSSYRQEVEAHVSYLYKQNCSRFAIFYQNDEYGKNVYLSTVKVLDEHNLSLVAEGSYKRNTLSIRHAYYEIKNAQPDAVIMIGAGNVNTLFINKAKEDEVFEKSYFSNISFGNASSMSKNFTNGASRVLFSQVVPNYQDTSLEVVREYHDALKEYNSEYEANFISLEAFLAAKTLVKAIEYSEKPLTHRKFLKSLKSLPSTTLEGLTLNYKNSQLLNHVYLFKYNNGQFVEIKQ